MSWRASGSRSGLQLDEPLEVRERLVLAPEREHRCRPELARLELELLEAADLRLREVEIEKLSVRLAAHERERLLRQHQRLARVRVAGLGDETREPLRVDVAPSISSR